MIRGTADLGSPRDSHHVVERRNPTPSTRERRRVPRMRVDNGTNILAGPEQIPVKAPLARRAPATKPLPVEVHQRNVSRLEFLVDSAGRADKKALLVPTNADVPRRPIRQPTARQLTTRRDQFLAHRPIHSAQVFFTVVPNRRTGNGGAGYRPILEFQ